MTGPTLHVAHRIVGLYHWVLTHGLHKIIQLPGILHNLTPILHKEKAGGLEGPFSSHHPSLGFPNPAQHLCYPLWQLHILTILTNGQNLGYNGIIKMNITPMFATVCTLTADVPDMGIQLEVVNICL